VLVTRPERDAGALPALLRGAGAIAIEAPTILILPAEDPGPLDDALQDVVDGEYEWMILTSPAGVEAIDARMVELGLAPPLPVKVAAIGTSTAEVLERDLHMSPDLVPTRFTSEVLGREFPPGRGRVLLPRVDIAPSGLEEDLKAKGWTPVRVTAYRTRHPESLPEDARVALAEGRVDVVVFTSSSTAEGFAQIAGADHHLRVVAIGPVTARTAEGLGFVVDAVAETHTIEGVVQACQLLFP
jgi:uroporphyrinogen-III synthase